MRVTLADLSLLQWNLATGDWTSCRRLPTGDPVGQLLITSPRQVVTYLGFPCDLVRLKERFSRHKPCLYNNHMNTVAEVFRTQGVCDDSRGYCGHCQFRKQFWPSDRIIINCLNRLTIATDQEDCDFSKFRQDWSFISCGNYRWWKYYSPWPSQVLKCFENAVQSDCHACLFGVHSWLETLPPSTKATIVYQYDDTIATSCAEYRTINPKPFGIHFSVLC